MSLFITLFLEFFKTGLFAIGGGLATLPFLYEMADKYAWFTAEQLSHMIAVSESTPGPIGVNMATYAGYNAGFSIAGFGTGVLGAAVATLGLITPSIIIILIISSFLTKFKDNRHIEDAFYTLRPAVTALIAVAGLAILSGAMLNFAAYKTSGNLTDLFIVPAIILFVLFLVANQVWKKIHPAAFILVGAVLGIVLKL